MTIIKTVNYCKEMYFIGFNDFHAETELYCLFHIRTTEAIFFRKIEVIF